MNEIDKTYIIKLHKVNPAIYWIDFFACALFGWYLFYLTVFSDKLLVMIPAFFFGTILIYRGQLFIHEVVHQRKNIKGLALAYEIFFGWPNSYPSYIHDPHLAHHGKKTYGTKDDAEYAYGINDNWLKMLQPIVSSLLLPIFSTIRFGLLPPLMLFFPKSWKVKIYQHASTLIVEPRYIRPMRSDSELKNMMINDLFCSVFRIGFILALIYGLLPIKTLWVWLAMIFTASVLNMYRTKIAHRYLGDGKPMSQQGQLLDSVTVSGSFLSGIWAPVGLRFHSAHHLYPVMPYHNLAKLHVYLSREEFKDHPYNKTVFSNFFKAIYHFATGKHK